MNIASEYGFSSRPPVGLGSGSKYKPSPSPKKKSAEFRQLRRSSSSSVKPIGRSSSGTKFEIENKMNYDRYLTNSQMNPF